jgi:hypothetical protein
MRSRPPPTQSGLWVALGLALTMSACRHDAAAPVADPAAVGAPLTADGARRIADALLAAHPTKDISYTFSATQESEHEFHVQYLVRRACKDMGVVVAEPSSDGSRTYTAVIDICPTGSPSGTTIRVLKADGHATFVGSE